MTWRRAPRGLGGSRMWKFFQFSSVWKLKRFSSFSFDQPFDVDTQSIVSASVTVTAKMRVPTSLQAADKTANAAQEQRRRVEGFMLRELSFAIVPRPRFGCC